MISLKEIYISILFKLSFMLRHNPVRFLYHDKAFSRLGLYVRAELPYFSRKWDGPIWDVGASVGKYTTLLAKANPDRLVYAFEPNLNSLYYLAYRTRSYSNIIIVPMALTADGQPIDGTIDPNFNAKPTGPLCATLSVQEAIKKFGKPAFVKMDIEGEEFRIFDTERQSLKDSTLLVSWHCQFVNRPIPALNDWKTQYIASDETLMEPLS